MYGPGEAANGHFDGFGAGRLVGGGGSHRRSEPDRPRTLVFGGSLAHGTESVQGLCGRRKGRGEEMGPLTGSGSCVYLCVLVRMCQYWYVLGMYYFPG